MNKTADQNRRSMPRVDSLFRVEPLDGGAVMFAQDLSLGGLYVTTRQLRWPGQIIALRFTLPDQNRAVRVSCRVLGLDESPGGAGLSLKFLRLSTESALAIHRYVDSRPIVSFDETVPSRIRAWIDRISDDCGELLALSRV